MYEKDTRTETFLTAMDVEYRFTNAIRFVDLEKDWQKKNLARPVPVREEAVIEYAALLESGSPAPAVIVHMGPDGYEVLDGVQRLVAGQTVGCSRFSAYIVDCDDEDTLIAINVISNVRLQGQAEPHEWSKRRAVEVLVLQRGLKASEVAAMGGWKVASITALAKTLKWKEELTRLGCPNLSDCMTESLAKYTTISDIKTAPKPTSDFLTTIKRAKLSAQDAEPYMEEMYKPVSKKTNLHTIHMKRVERFKEDPEIQARIHGRKGPQQPKDVTLMKQLKSAVKVVDDMIDDGYVPVNMDEFFRLLGVLETKLKKMDKKRPQKKTAATPADKWTSG